MFVLVFLGPLARFRLCEAFAFGYLNEVHTFLPVMLAWEVLVSGPSQRGGRIHRLVSPQGGLTVLLCNFLLVSSKIGQRWLLKVYVSRQTHSFWVTYISKNCLFHLFSSFC